MASRKGNPVHGWVILDKPIGLTSSRAVGIVRRIFTAAKAHGGTLDPLASGLLPIALGEATKPCPSPWTGRNLSRSPRTPDDHRRPRGRDGDV